MDSKNLTIIPPEGMEAYQEGNEIKFRPIKKNIVYYEDVARKLFYDKLTYYITGNGTLDTFHPTSSYYNANNCTSNKQLRKLLAINKLMNVAKYLNDGWQPDWCNYYTRKYYIFIDSVNNNISISYNDSYCGHYIYFKSEELAKQAIEILGEETIKLALSTDW